jgi:hypothetical protein
MSDKVISDVKEFYLMVRARKKSSIQSKHSLELLFMHALKKMLQIVVVYYFGEILLGVEDRAVIAYFATLRTISPQ